MRQADIGLIGLAVMGENLAMNMESKGYTVAVYNRTTEKVARFAAGNAKGRNILPAFSLEELVQKLKKPRRIFMMVKAGGAVDELIEALVPLLEKGDILIDGGNTHFPDTIRRTAYVEEQGLLYVGTGVSGGEEGALHGPSLMPGGSAAAWEALRPIFTAISAKAPDGSPCCGWVGENGAGHFVKMVHNGIEYGDMQIICEAYQLMRDGWNMSAEEIGKVFEKWNQGRLNSYLIGITADILMYRDEDGQPLVDKILDTAGQKGTGKWTAITALEEGTALTLIGESVFSRCLSAMKAERVLASGILKGPEKAAEGDREVFLADLEQALFASKLVSYAQGFALMRAASESYGWSLDYGSIAMMWRGGCIIRSAFLERIRDAYGAEPELRNLLLAPFFAESMIEAQKGWRRICAQAVTIGVPAPAMTSALAYYDGYRAERLPANLLQAQRDYFGAHTYERLDAPRGEHFHTNWTGKGGDTAAGVYGV